MAVVRLRRSDKAPSSTLCRARSSAIHHPGQLPVTPTAKAAVIAVPNQYSKPPAPCRVADSRRQVCHQDNRALPGDCRKIIERSCHSARAVSSAARNVLWSAPIKWATVRSEKCSSEWDHRALRRIGGLPRASGPSR